MNENLPSLGLLSALLLPTVWEIDHGSASPAYQEPPAIVQSVGDVGETIGGTIAPDGTTQIQLDLPKELHLRNKGGSDGAGLCVCTSINHSAYWNNIPVLQDFRDYMTHYPGGGYPDKVDKYIDRICKEKNAPKPDYFNVETGDLEILKLAVKTGRMPGVTYSFGSRYGGRIAHMVTLVHAGAGKGPDGRGWWAILDNNFPGTIAWMGESEFRRTFTGGGARGWAWIPLNPGPPPVPRNN